jgi:hypothetical protein
LSKRGNQGPKQTSRATLRIGAFGRRLCLLIPEIVIASVARGRIFQDAAFAKARSAHGPYGRHEQPYAQYQQRESDTEPVCRFLRGIRPSCIGCAVRVRIVIQHRGLHGKFTRLGP